MSAVIGGTAEALGGGKFANGSVIGAYVMMFNHLGHDWRERKASLKMKALALTIRSTPYLSPTQPNPFYGADAIFFDGGGLLVGAELDAGYFFVVSGDDIGKVIPFSELAGGVSPSSGGGIEFGRIDLADKSLPFQAKMLFGMRDKTWIDIGFVGGAGIGGARAVSYYRGNKIISRSLNIGFTPSPFGWFSFGWNHGEIKPKK
jgi:hypothetical protein